MGGENLQLWVFQGWWALRALFQPTTLIQTPTGTTPPSRITAELGGLPQPPRSPAPPPGRRGLPRSANYAKGKFVHKIAARQTDSWVGPPPQPPRLVSGSAGGWGGATYSRDSNTSFPGREAGGSSALSNCSFFVVDENRALPCPAPGRCTCRGVGFTGIGYEGWLATLSPPNPSGRIGLGR